MDLKKIAASCEYGDLKDELIRDRIVCGTTYENVRKQMLKERDLNLDRAIELCRIDELTQQRLKQFKTENSVDEIRRNGRPQ